jgi:hypothetical protein
VSNLEFDSWYAGYHYPITIQPLGSQGLTSLEATFGIVSIGIITSKKKQRNLVTITMVPTRGCNNKKEET